VALVKDGRLGAEVIGVAAVLLARGVADEVGGPSEELLNDNAGEVVERSIFEEIINILEHGLILAMGRLGRLLDSLVSRWEADLGACLGDEDLVALHGSSSSVVSGMADSPAVVRDEEGRVADPSDGVVDGLARGKSLVSALMRNNPHSSTHTAGTEAVDRPSSYTCSLSNKAIEDIPVLAQVAIDKRSEVGERSEHE